VEDKATSDSYTTPYKFTGKELDAETGLYYFGARYYDAKISRWISTDPALEKYFPKPNDYDTEHDFYWYYKQANIKKLKGHGGVFRPINLDNYRYCGNNPMVIIDPDGKLDNKVYMTDPDGNNKTIAPMSVKGGPKVDVTKIAKAQQEQKQKTIDSQKRNQQQNIPILVGACSVMVVGAALVPVVVIGSAEGLTVVANYAVINAYTINSAAVGAIQGFAPPSPTVFNDLNMVAGFIAGYFTEKMNDSIK
jgi:RHS repeat-associated protein